ncbi:hypothetical protein HCH15_07430 [Corynebacterium testudinoris]|uniref:Low molecular weight antigen MTB12-like C-terminal domain-containing protein n=1 Tax=Corynebacterium testudinoris TaxID=136857 RepID=A0A0G3HDK2_9CORY|nr:hypothetical protein [Corynebacterium testudinoris]AKK09202.1 hypothetical protein CTEST_08860 [Corynebacterium testudinoris]MBX8996015.1 hypothetical protein [Corynebacterium testudinoris]
MKLTKITAVAAAVGAALALTACSSDDGGSATTSAKTSASESAVAAPTLPTADELNEVLARATDPNVPLEGKVSTVQGGETAPELFETMAASQAESGAQFQVVNPVLPGYTPDSVLASVNFTLPDQPAQPAENVEFIFENGEWKLSQSWACTLITNTVAPDQVPAMCQEFAPAPAPAEEAPAEAPADAPAPAPAS